MQVVFEKQGDGILVHIELQKSYKLKAAVTAFLIVTFASASIFIPTFATSEPNYFDISVQTAYQMIRQTASPILILDVRYQCEYDMGHLYGAILIPYDQLQTRIDEIQAYSNQKIIVYCKTGYRSQLASEILANNSFTQVYNMLGGIFAWIEAGYPIFTTSHYATVDMAYGLIETQIDPMTLHQTGLPPCTQSANTSQFPQCPSCGSNPDNVTNLTNGTITIGNISASVIAQMLSADADHVILQATASFGSTVFGLTLNVTKLWLYDETSNTCERAAGVLSFNLKCDNASLDYYCFFYRVANSEYNLTVATALLPFVLDDEIYAQSSTSVVYSSSGTKTISSEYVGFNSSIDSLSHEYAILAHVTRKMGLQYLAAQDGNLMQLAFNYFDIASELSYASSIVKYRAVAYDKPILTAQVSLIDPCDSNLNGYIATACGLPFWGLCTIGCALVTGGIAAIACPFICGALAGAFCIAFADAICGVPITTVDLGCGAICGAVEPHFTDPLTQYLADQTCGQICSGIWTYLVAGTIPPPPPDDGYIGGECPMLSVYDGQKYNSQGLLDIHAESDVITSRVLNVTPARILGTYEFCLTEHQQTISHINQVKLFATLTDGETIQLPLIYAIHSQWGDVYPQLFSNDNSRAVEVGADWNSGLSQSIFLGFLALPSWLHATSYTFVIQGHNRIAKL